MTRLVAAEAPLPEEPGDVDLMLRFRDVLVDSFRQRLHDLGCLPSVDQPPSPIRAAMAYPDYLIPGTLAAVSSALPRMQETDRPPPSEVFAVPRSSLCTDLWRTAALESLAASNALSADPAAWASTAARWLVVRDLAVGLEAVVLLDDVLREVGLLNQHDAPSAPGQVAETRAVLSQAARVASWRATTYAADDLAPRSRPEIMNEVREHGPVRLVRSMTDLPAAQERLARALTPLTAHNSAFTGEPHLSARAARHLVIGQLQVTVVSQQIVSRRPALKQTQVLADRAHQLSEIDRHLSYLVDHDPRLQMAGTLIYWQQAEITTSLRRMIRDRDLQALPPGQQTALNDANAAACRQLAVALRRELLRDDTNLRLADPTGQVGPTRVHRYSPLERALTDLVRTAEPSPHSATSVSLQRAVLKQTVDTTPTPPPLVRRPTPKPTHARSR